MAEYKSSDINNISIVGRIVSILTMAILVFFVLDIGGLVLSGNEANRQYLLRVDDSMRKSMSEPIKVETRSPEELNQLMQKDLEANKKIRYSILKEYKLTMGIVLMIVFLGISIFRRRPHELVFGLAVIFLSLQFSLFSP